MRAGLLYVVGLALDALGFAASLAALRSLPLFLVESAVASSLAVTAVLARVFLDTRLERAAVIALGAVGVGLVGLATSAAEGRAEALDSTGARILLLAVVPVALGGALALRMPSRVAVPVLASVAGLGFGGTAVAARDLGLGGPWRRLLLQPDSWALLAFAGIGLVAYGLALQRGSVTVVAAVTFAVETVVPAGIGLLFLGDRVRPGDAWIAVSAFALAVGGCLRLARFATVEPEPQR